VNACNLDDRRTDVILERVLDVILALCDEMQTTDNATFAGTALSAALEPQSIEEQRQNDYNPETIPC
jgi:hypothetical protein